MNKELLAEARAAQRYAFEHGDTGNALIFRALADALEKSVSTEPPQEVSALIAEARRMVEYARSKSTIDWSGSGAPSDVINRLADALEARMSPHTAELARLIEASDYDWSVEHDNPYEARAQWIVDRLKEFTRPALGSGDLWCIICQRGAEGCMHDIA